MSGPDTQPDGADGAASGLPAGTAPGSDGTASPAGTPPAGDTRAGVPDTGDVPVDDGGAAAPPVSGDTAGPRRAGHAGQAEETGEAAEAGEAGEPRDTGESGDDFRGPLPDGVRQRIVGIAADALGGMSHDEVPGPLRQFARFTPSRRAKLAATHLATALEADEVFRQRVAERLRRALPDLAGTLDTGSVPAAADPVDVAAAAYLLRPPGWARLVGEAGDAAERAAAGRAGAEAEERAARLAAELTALRGSARAEQDRLRGELEDLRKETEHLRRQVRGLQGGAKHAEKEARTARAELAGVRAEAERAVAAAEKENRRLRARLAEAEAALEAGRKAAREGRSMADTRARLLLDTVLEAAQGLRRELALPPVTIRPGDTVDAVEPEAFGAKDVARRALEGDDPALLDQLLALPQAHLVVDGYNVTKEGYPSLSLSEQRMRLLAGLAVIAAQTGCELTCVFDGADLSAPVLLAPPRGVRVRFSRAGETADELIRRLVRAEPAGRPVVVVSSDREVADGVRRAGARPVSSAMLLRRLARG